MDTMICVGPCRREKLINAFELRSDTGGRRTWCKECRKEYLAKYYKKNIKRIKRKAKKYRNAHKEDIATINKLWRQNNKERKKNLDRIYRQNNRDSIRVMKRKYKNKRLKTDINFKIKEALRHRVYLAIKNGQKGGSAIFELGCSITELKSYLESMFYINPRTGEQMTWYNYGFYGWHIDHIVPLAFFDLTDPIQFRQACHYTNLQPLWAADNFEKSDKLQDGK